MTVATAQPVAVKERPILFSSPMVRALLAGTKTQTRRVVKPQPPQPYPNGVGVTWEWWPERDAFVPSGTLVDFTAAMRGGIRCPYGKPGDRLWVRETFFVAEVYSHGTLPCGEPIEYRGVNRGPIHYAADGNPANTPNRSYPKGLREGCGKFAAPDPYAIWIKHPTIHMPRWASRITLEVTGVRVERLQDISHDDAVAEGMLAHPNWDGHRHEGQQESRILFRETWDCINGKTRRVRREGKWVTVHGTPWSSNPWCWVVEFKRL